MIKKNKYSIIKYNRRKSKNSKNIRKNKRSKRNKRSRKIIINKKKGGA